MAKILRQGKDVDKPWIGKTVTCSYCHCKFKLDKNDKAKVQYDQRDGDYYETQCANSKCRRRVTFTLPGK